MYWYVKVVSCKNIPLSTLTNIWCIEVQLLFVHKTPYERNLFGVCAIKYPGCFNHFKYMYSSSRWSQAFSLVQGLQYKLSWNQNRNRLTSWDTANKYFQNPIDIRSCTHYQLYMHFGAWCSYISLCIQQHCFLPLMWRSWSKRSTQCFHSNTQMWCLWLECVWIERCPFSSCHSWPMAVSSTMWDSTRRNSSTLVNLQNLRLPVV